MATRKQKPDVGRFQRAEEMRQAILDFLHASPGASMAACAEHISTTREPVTPQRMGDYLKRMILFGEVGREPRAAIDCIGKRCSGYYAIKHTTTRWQDMHLATQQVNAPEPQRPKVGPNGGRVHYSGDIPAISKYPSGGQGALVRPAMGSGMYGGDW